MKLTLIYAILLGVFCTYHNATGQVKYNLDFEFGEKTKTGLTETSFGVVAKNDNFIYVLSGKGKGVGLALPGGFGPVVGIGTKVKLELQIFDHDLNIKKELSLEDIALGALNGAPDKTYEFIYQDKQEKIWLFFSTHSKSANHLYRMRLNDNNSGFEKPILVSRQSGDKNHNRQGTYNYKLSPNKELLCIYSYNSVKKAKSTDVYVEVMDRDFKRQWIILNKIPQYNKDGYLSTLASSLDKATNIKSENIKLTNEGSFYFLSKVKEKKEKLEKYVLYAFSNGKRNAITKVFSNTKYYNNALYLQPYNGKVGVVGYYSDVTSKSKDIKGIMIEMMDPITLKTLNSIHTPFTNKQRKDFMVSDAYPKSAEKAGKFVGKDEKLNKQFSKGKDVFISGRTKPLRLFFHSNNSFTLASEMYNEQTYVTTSTDPNTGMSSTSSNFKMYYGDVCFVNFDDKGKVNWIKNYHKYQVLDRNTILCKGMFMEQFDDTILFFYANMNVDKIQFAEVDFNGNIHSRDVQPLKNGRIDKYYFVPESYVKLGENTYLGNNLKSFKSKLTKLVITENTL
ncbi:hypothetical protein KMW28_07915 [Flammeovirga yaeyamensis]|uniref:Uncharacterized protein n=1 Tax=Flammeovirga yaeyamensis TaxID=367791 RepID=A0AAX1NB42_9BACT|nr:hypothetical protein [Flammeovirga yaeyamensis]MBB3699108.1 hypothetical protein [Flammeovirga yaeyamensis]NMF36542.1 hypothetical protein [Flammeovirga yaeyamensis]QWG03500.1 hypothetical protein KMW28_07915 [Flammeovirga yaeyamensis]